MKTPISVNVPNLDLYIASLLEDMTAEQKSKLPLDLSYKLFGSKADPFKKLTFFEKWFLLFKIFNKDVFFFVRDEKNGMTAADFENFVGGKMTDTERANTLIAKGDFVISNNEFSEAILYTSKSCIGAAYNYAISLKNKKKIRPEDSPRQLRFFVDLFFQYEANKRKLLRDNETGIAELFILQYLYDGRLKSSTDLYDGILKGAPNCSRRTFMDGFRKMRHAGYIQKTGYDRAARYNITILGKHFLHELLLKYVIPS